MSQMPHKQIPRISRALFKLTMLVSGRNTDLYYALHLINQYQLLHKQLQCHSPTTKTQVQSKAAYEAYDNREQLENENRTTLSWHKGRLRKIPLAESREHYLRYLYEAIDERITLGSPIKILEVGCGNCINLASLKKRYGSLLLLSGLEISQQRIRVAKEHFGHRLSGIAFYIQSITDRIEALSEGEFDIVFSMHCLEQITYQSTLAIKEMHRLAKSLVIMIEPVYELGNPTQRLYLINQDHNRTLLSAINELGLAPTRIEPLDIQSNPLNQSSIIVIEKHSEQKDVPSSRESQLQGTSPRSHLSSRPGLRVT